MTTKPWWPRLKLGTTLVFFALVGWLLTTQARQIDWGEVVAALQTYPATSLGLAVALAAASFTLYSCYDLLSRRYTGHTLSTPTVMTVTFISYVFNLNLGSLVGGIAFRYRLYSRLGLAPGVITRITTFSMLTNWVSYLLLGGLIFVALPPPLPEQWPITTLHLRLIGALLAAVGVGYLALCALSRQRTLHWRGHAIDLPSIRLALVQIAVGAGNWLLMSGIIYVLLQQRIEFTTVVSVLLLAAVAGVIAHIPAGLGVLEAVFVALLAHRMPQPEILAALVAYRVVYYLGPLVIAALVYLVTEARAKKLARGVAPEPARQS
ncbi:MAG: lysylphosphatidylglycerol synthase domain-containing protein [Polaromonas sp.]|nr:lysylphosphatidylglycerol synthase domain-containing protein [Polaromonas sp.]